MRHLSVAVFALFAAGVASGVAACGGSEPEPGTAAGIAPSGTYPYPSYTYPPGSYPPPTASTAPPTASTATPNPLAPVEPALQQAAQAILNELALREAPGAKPVGETRVALLGTNQTAEQAVSLQPGKCYTVIASGLMPITEVNIQLYPEIAVPGVNLVLAQDQTQGAQAVLGSGANCYKWALSAEGRVRVVTTVAAGAGVVATQVYAK